MKMCAARSSSSRSNLLLALLLLGTSVVRGLVVAPTRISIRSTARASGVGVPRAAGADPTGKKSGKPKPGLDDIGGQIQATRDQMRDFIWKATDSIVQAVEDMPDIGRANTTQTLSRLGSILEDFDDKYFSKYLTSGATPSYQDTLAAATSSTTVKKGGGGKGAAASASKGGGGKSGNAKEESKAVAKASAAVSSALSEAAAGAAKTGSSTGDAVVEMEGKVKGKAEEAVAAATKNLAGSASGTVQLDRPKKVQGVFDDIQAKAVQYYKASPATATSKSSPAVAGGGGGVATPLPEAVQILEAKLESYLTESRFRPRKLKKEKKSGLVDTITAMEASYPADANPLGDPALSGQWSVVYSSSSKLIGRALRGVLAGFFKTSDARQVVDAGASSVMNACRARLRMTPLALRVAKKGSYRATGDRKVFVDMPATKKGVLRRLLPNFRSGKVEAEVTYLSKKWRICRANGVTVAFRKSGD